MAWLDSNRALWQLGGKWIVVTKRGSQEPNEEAGAVRRRRKDGGGLGWGVEEVRGDRFWNYRAGRAHRIC